MTPASKNLTKHTQHENEEMKMSIRMNTIKSTIAALTGVSLLALAVAPASAMTVPSPALDQAVGAQVELAHWHGDRGWGRHDDGSTRDHISGTATGTRATATTAVPVRRAPSSAAS